MAIPSIGLIFMKFPGKGTQQFKSLNYQRNMQNIEWPSRALVHCLFIIPIFKLKAGTDAGWYDLGSFSKKNLVA